MATTIEPSIAFGLGFALVGFSKIVHISLSHFELKTCRGKKVNIKPVVDWQSPDDKPHVPKGESEMFWIAVNSRRSDGSFKTYVFDAQYLNQPLELNEEGEPFNENQMVDIDGDWLEAVGWYSLKEHSEFPEFYEPINFNEDYVLLGWGMYQKPDFKAG